MEKIWVNGCFDILHRGHIQMLEYAKSLGSHLCVGIDSDRKVKENKGPTRPYNNEDDRKFLLQALHCVDEVVIFDTKQELEDRIKNMKPSVMVIGSDWEGKEVVGAKYATRVSFYERVGDYSTTNLLEINK
jgi:rfaE bifunctional protein nucleotidyltransferase chain/domain